MYIYRYLYISWGKHLHLVARAFVSLLIDIYEYTRTWHIHKYIRTWHMYEYIRTRHIHEYIRTWHIHEYIRMWHIHVHVCLYIHKFMSQMKASYVYICLSRSRRRLHLRYLEHTIRHVSCPFFWVTGTPVYSRENLYVIWGNPVKTCLKVTGTPIKTCLNFWPS